MIKIERADCPNSLRAKKKAKAAFRNKDVVETLWNMQHKKCAYCEVKIPLEGHQKAVDHFKPRGIFKSRVNDWKNLLLVCAQCNGRKSDKFPVELTNKNGEAMVVYIKKDTKHPGMLIDPADSTNDPEEHLDFVMDDPYSQQYGLIYPKNNSGLGRESIDVIGLYREHYTKKHKKHMRKMARFLLTLLDARDQGEEFLEQDARIQVRMMLSAKGELAAVARAFAKKEGIDVKLGIPIPTGWESA